MPLLRPLAAAALAVLLASSAGAHATKEGTVPADGATLAASPPVIALMFDAPMRITRLLVLNAAGDEQPLAQKDGTTPARRYQAVPEPLAPGAYEVRWRGMAEDGHTMRGSFAFTVE